MVYWLFGTLVTLCYTGSKKVGSGARRKGHKKQKEIDAARQEELRLERERKEAEKNKKEEEEAARRKVEAEERARKRREEWKLRFPVAPDGLCVCAVPLLLP